ncbi:flagellar hook-associated protein FlgK [Sinorhizobium medicae]|uniref:Flagellar hook-associated protein 1 n=2 Tax=Sinorhizobium medicae TaxID=110321 RepID=A6U656_SINMW|nr:flagellar hook-associated protein FlgK [Sinorhizobium medicae]ABR59136.1 flagellar hook-associated protein FlgK [Sinorhizobium medicae WSM419]MBO1939191.1 flagellar hook-associated protein FlgK [Sinorhizobium medicae]MBO1963579.1 flagellar hook-associated protein FlgK [Sinorhizobium medicae]MDX0406157.1 flagellar hook-associated protein FlgK [Sinorhizobium medicae]MDX0412925.1 flagellar hook-associated protein FlgK [Sinorhizobium medicae]
MSLSSAIAIAQSAFSTTAQQTATVSKNIANSGNADYSRRMAMLGTTPGGAQIVSIYRAQNEALLKQNLISISQSSAQSSLLSGLEIMKSALGGNDYESAPSTYLSAFRNSLQTFASTPGNATIAATVVSDASDLANSISRTSAAVQDLRLDTDKKIAEDVANLNRLLAQFETANNAVRQATAAGTDATAALDDRDRILKQVSELVGISTVTRANNDTVIYTAGGTVLFETLPREVTFAPKSAYDATVTGNGIFIDGVPLAAGNGADTNAQGKLAGLLQLRDDIAPTFQTQLDEMARGLVSLFQEGGLPGLFTWSGGNVPAAGAVEAGIAAYLSVNPAAKSNPFLLRDGGFNGIVSNPGNNAGFTDLLDSFVAAMDGDMAFDSAAGLDGTSSIMEFAASSVGWFEQIRSGASTADDNKAALLARTQEALGSVTGVSIDEELSLLLDLEQSYKASAKLISTVDAMMASLLEAVR